MNDKKIFLSTDEEWTLRKFVVFQFAHIMLTQCIKFAVENPKNAVSLTALMPKIHKISSAMQHFENEADKVLCEPIRLRANFKTKNEAIQSLHKLFEFASIEPLFEKNACIEAISIYGQQK